MILMRRCRVDDDNARGVDGGDDTREMRMLGAGHEGDVDARGGGGLGEGRRGTGGGSRERDDE